MPKALPCPSYASGENPRFGDLVCRTAADPITKWPAPSVKIGDVVKVYDLSRPVYEAHLLPWLSDGDQEVPIDPGQFNLIARARDQVTYQPGDVVEVIDPDCSAYEKGARYTVDADGRIPQADSDSGTFAIADMRPGIFQLVHRPQVNLSDDCMEVRGMDLSRTRKDILDRAFAAIADATGDAKIKGILVQPISGLLTVEAWPDGDTSKPAKTYHETQSGRLAHIYGAPNAAHPPVGETLTPETAKLLQPGDLVRVHRKLSMSNNPGAPAILDGSCQRVFKSAGRFVELCRPDSNEPYQGGGWLVDSFTFIGRPDADGWVAWGGGENLFGDTVLETRHRNGEQASMPHPADWWHDGPGFWIHDGSPNDIVAFRLPRHAATKKSAADRSQDYVNYVRYATYPTVFDMQQRPVFTGTPHSSLLRDVDAFVEGHTDRVAVPGKFRLIRGALGVVFEDLRPIEAGCPVTWDRAPGKVGRVVSIDPGTDEAWVRWQNSANPRDYSTVKRADLRRVPGLPIRTGAV